MPLTLLWLQLAAAAGIILVAAHFMARAADIIAEKTGLGRSFIGVVMLASATSLPELGTGVSSIVLVGEVDLAAGDAFGSNLFNLLIIGLLDLYWRRGPILASVTLTSALVGVQGILIISVALVALVFHSSTSVASGWPLSPMTALMFAIFMGAMYLTYRDERNSEGKVEGGENYEGSSLPKVFITYLITASIVVGAAIWLANIGEDLAHEMRWETSFVGTQFLALSTSLPEMAASFAAVRLGAPELAITNLLGSNLFNMGFVLFADDLVFTQGVLWASVAEIHIMTAMIAMVMTATVVTGILINRQYAFKMPVTVEAGAMIALYAAASALVFQGR
ncbi:MAG: hypothetical protein F4X94_05365 [Dehalococcoidia bacterium]|nr:hypothetical protein [Dehalococcoidia bacterium]